MFIHKPSQTVVFNAVDPLALRDLMPRFTRTINAPEGNIAVRYNPDTARVLKNLGYDTPSPTDLFYDWPGKYTPFDHQRIMVDTITRHPKVFNLSEMGTGKTYASLWAADYLMKIGAVHKVLILAPLSTVERVWLQDIFDILMHRTAKMANGTEKVLDMLKLDLDFYIVNHDGIALTEVAKAIRKRTDIDLVIVDEASIFRNHKSRKYKFLKWVLERKDRLCLITGTPTPNAPTDAWPLVRLVNPAAVPPYLGQFKRETMYQVTNFKWVPRTGSDKIVYKAMRPAVRFRKADCLDLPPVITVPMQSQVTKQQRIAFDAMQNEMVLQTAKTEISAVNAADQINKLRQILCGAMRDPNTGEYIVLDHAPRLANLCTAIDNAAAKVLVIVPFKGIIRVLEQELSGRYPLAVLNGDVTPRMRNEIIRNFKTTPTPHLLLCHPKVMAHGLNLVEADTTIFYAPIYSNDEYRQVVERNNRAGQTRNMTIVRLAAHPLEWEIYRMVDNKDITQDNILSLYRQVTQ